MVATLDLQVLSMIHNAGLESHKLDLMPMQLSFIGKIKFLAPVVLKEPRTETNKLTSEMLFGYKLVPLKLPTNFTQIDSTKMEHLWKHVKMMETLFMDLLANKSEKITRLTMLQFTKLKP